MVRGSGEGPRSSPAPAATSAAPSRWRSPDELAKIPLRRLGRPEDIADACVFLATDASAYVTGDSIRVMGGRVIG